MMKQLLLAFMIPFFFGDLIIAQSPINLDSLKTEISKDVLLVVQQNLQELSGQVVKLEQEASKKIEQASKLSDEAIVDMVQSVKSETKQESKRQIEDRLEKLLIEVEAMIDNANTATFDELELIIKEAGQINQQETEEMVNKAIETKLKTSSESVPSSSNDDKDVDIESLKLQVQEQNELIQKLSERIEKLEKENL